MKIVITREGKPTYMCSTEGSIVYVREQGRDELRTVSLVISYESNQVNANTLITGTYEQCQQWLSAIVQAEEAGTRVFYINY
ncbi:MAG: hypothetical protein LBN99_02325 [Oscillospiraceae bacterium]|jgi:hypothetical protein|nr:hypothetical protein [Oscillospiraceae bacterium]